MITRVAGHPRMRGVFCRPKPSQAYAVVHVLARPCAARALTLMSARGDGHGAWLSPITDIVGKRITLRAMYMHLVRAYAIVVF